MKTIIRVVAFAVLHFVTPVLFGQEEVMDFKELQEYLPTSIPGYSPGEPGGSSMSTDGLTFSSADIEFLGPENQFLRITLLDYSGAAKMFEAATAMWTSGLSFEDDQSKVSTFEINDQIKGWEEFRKASREAQIALGIGNRFFLTIEGNEQSGTTVVKEIANSMKLMELLNR